MNIMNDHNMRRRTNGIAFISLLVFIIINSGISSEASCSGPRCGKHIGPSITKSWTDNLSVKLLNCSGNNNNPECTNGVTVSKREWAFLSSAFLKCTHWQVEETMDTLNCPYHYYCSSLYPGNYPVLIDWFALVLAATSCLFLGGVLIWEFRGVLLGRQFNKTIARYCLPSGPFMLPFLLLLLAKGLRINTLFPLSYIGPALLQLLHVSALGTIGFELYGVSKNLNAVVFEISMASGLLHSSLYVDSLAMPYYTGLDAFTSSSLSGICRSCICRREPLIAGGRFGYRAWSYGSFVVVSALLSRLAYGLWWKNPTRDLLNCVRLVLEFMAWGLTIYDVVKMMKYRPLAQQGLPYTIVLAPLVVVLLLVLSKRVWNLWRLVKDISWKYTPLDDREDVKSESIIP